MRNPYKILYQGGTAEIVEKKSRFIASLRPVKTEEEALLFLEETRKKYWDARHNCYAWIIGEHGEQKRCSDDGEPSQTAGRPMLDVLLLPVTSAEPCWEPADWCGPILPLSRRGLKTVPCSR